MKDTVDIMIASAPAELAMAFRRARSRVDERCRRRVTNADVLAYLMGQADVESLTQGLLDHIQRTEPGVIIEVDNGDTGGTIDEELL